MSLFPGRERSALLVIDVQNGVVGPQAWKRAETLSNIAAGVANARAAGAPVLWIQHSSDWLKKGHQEWEVVAELDPRPDEPRIGKNFRSSFEGTELDSTLERLGVAHLVLCGAQSDYCVRHTTHAALERGYDVTLLSDAHTTVDSEWRGTTIAAQTIVDEQNRATHGYDLPGRRSRVAATADVVFAPG